MRKEQKILGLILVVMLSAGTVFADITTDSALYKPTFSRSSQPVRLTGQAVRSSATSPLMAVNGLKPDFQSSFNLDQPKKATNIDTQGAQAKVKELPAGPDSAMLFLCALGSVGIFHAGKSAKKLNFALVPDWYHSGGLRQIGHVHALELDFYLVAIPLAAFFNQPENDSLKVYSRADCENAGRFKSQFSLPPQAPRGPPILS